MSKIGQYIVENNIQIEQPTVVFSSDAEIYSAYSELRAILKGESEQVITDNHEEAAKSMNDKLR